MLLEKFFILRDLKIEFENLQIEFGSIDFQHLYDLHRLVFLKSIGSRCVYRSEFVCMLNIQFL